MPVTINGTTGIAGVDGSASTPSYQGTDTNTGIFYPAADTIAFAEGGTEVMRLDSSGNLLVGTTSASTPSSTGFISTANTFGFKNRIINGAMQIDQRNAGASVTVSNATVTYITDRWNVFEDTSGAISSQQSTTAPSGFTNSLLVSVTSAGTATAAQLCRVQQRIEGFNVADLGFGTASAKSITISFWVRSSLTGTYCVNVRNNATDRSYVATYTINSANTFEYKTITIAGDTTGTWLTNNGVGMFISWDLGSGSNANTTAGSWTAANKENTSAQANWIGTASATFYITGVQLEAGTVATSFDVRPYGTELMLCQRYFEKSFEMATAPAQNTGSYSGTAVASSPGQLSGMSFGDTRFKVNKRVSPSITFYNPAAANAFARDQNAGVDCSATSAWVIGESAFAITASTGSGSGITNRVGVHWIASAEL